MKQTVLRKKLYQKKTLAAQDKAARLLVPFNTGTRIMEKRSYERKNVNYKNLSIDFT